MGPKSLTGVIHLPDVRLNFHVNFAGKKGETDPQGEEAELLNSIFEQCISASPELQEILVNFADHIKKAAEKTAQDPVT